jgi:predicted DNA-binding transcriptional regulator AlpA
VKAIKRKARNAKTSRCPALPEANEAHRVTAGPAAETDHHESDRKSVCGQRAPPPDVRLLSKAEVCAVANRSFPTIWKMMRAGTFPRARVSGAKSFWLSTEVENWIAALPVRPLKGDKRARQANESKSGC